MKAVVATFNQEKALVGAFSVITNLQMQFGCIFLRHAVFSSTYLNTLKSRYLLYMILSLLL